MVIVLWLFIVAIWWLAGLIGLAFAFASLRAALGMRKAEVNDRVTDLVLYLAVARSIIFIGPFLGAPILYNMFRLRGSTSLGDVVPVVLPFGVILLGALILVVATTVTLALTIMEIRAVLKSDDDV